MVKTASNPLPAFKTDESKARYMAAYDAALANWPVPYEELDVATRLGTTHIIASGSPDAPPLVLLPSLAASATVWRLNIAGLSRHYRTYAVDVIGQPGKSVATQRLRNRRQLADWMIDVLDGLGVQRTSMVGCSFGGFLALNQASLTPQRIERVVLISPVGGFASQYWKLTYLMRIKRPILKLVHRFVTSKRAPGPADSQAKNAAPFIPPRDAKWGALMAVTMSERPKISVTRAPAFSGVELRAIRAPTLLLIGDQERVYEPHATLKRAQERMPGLSGAVVPNADHIAAMAQPDDVNERIIQFLR
jgi:pimeloyl-ACP methyl ester carboxylesterase